MCHYFNYKDYYVEGWTNIDWKYLGIDKDKILPQSATEMFGAETNTKTLELKKFQTNEYIIPNTIFTNKITAIDLNEKKQLVGLGGDPDIGQGGFLIDDVLNNHNVRNFYSDGDN